VASPAEKEGSLSAYYVDVWGVSRSFGQGGTAVHVLRDLDLHVRRGELVALYGPSGSGKTTLLNLIGALDRPDAGAVEVGGEDILQMSEGERARFRRSQFGFIFQNYTLLPTYTALENVDLVLRLPGIGYFERRKRAHQAIKAMGLSAWANHVPDELSGGQQQRVAIARALALRANLVLADEPTSGLDTRTARGVLALFRGIAQTQQTTFLIVSHDPMITEYVDTAYDLQDGSLSPRLKQPGAPKGTSTNGKKDPNSHHELDVPASDRTGDA
jgi:putative ABC transport system ATP-binding protein